MTAGQGETLQRPCKIAFDAGRPTSKITGYPTTTLFIQSVDAHSRFPDRDASPARAPERRQGTFQSGDDRLSRNPAVRRRAAGTAREKGNFHNDL